MPKRSKPKANPNAETTQENSFSVEIGRIAKLFAMYLLRDVNDEGDKILRLSAVGFSVKEIALMLDKTENNVRVSMFKARKKKPSK